MVPLFWSSLACTAVDEGWESIPIASAWLEQFDRSTLALVGGGFDGDALLAWQGPYGLGVTPVHVGGGTFGLVFAISIDPEGHDGVVPIDLTGVDAPTVDDVFGTYQGTGVAAGLGAGVERSRVRNASGASFREDHFAVGLGLWAGIHWIRLSPAEPASTFTATTPYSTTPYSTTPYTTPYSTPYTTSTLDTGPSAPPPSADDDSSGGCGGGGDEDPATPAVDTGNAAPDTGGSSTSSDCDCATGSVQMRAGWLWLAVLWGANRRRSV